MKIAIAADHAGFALKEKLRQRLAGEGHEVVDFGPANSESCDYPDFAQPVARDVAQGRSDQWNPGLLHRHRNGDSRQQRWMASRAAPAVSEDEVRLIRELHHDANVLTIGAKYTDEDHAASLIELFLGTEFTGGRHARRVAKIAQLEKSN